VTEPEGILFLHPNSITGPADERFSIYEDMRRRTDPGPASNIQSRPCQAVSKWRTATDAASWGDTQGL